MYKSTLLSFFSLCVLAARLHGETARPTAKPEQNLRDTLFADSPIHYWGAIDSTTEPWPSFARTRIAIAGNDTKSAVSELRRILATPNLESRHYLQAWHFLRQLGIQPSPDQAKSALGVVFEIALPEGLDLLAVYADGSARYYNYSGAGVVWDKPDSSLQPQMAEVLAAAKAIADVIRPWKGGRPDPPPADSGRLSVLTPSGQMFRQGLLTDLAADPLTGRLLSAGTVLVQALFAKTKERTAGVYSETPNPSLQRTPPGRSPGRCR